MCCACPIQIHISFLPTRVFTCTSFRIKTIVFRMISIYDSVETSIAHRLKRDYILKFKQEFGCKLSTPQYHISNTLNHRVTANFNSSVADDHLWVYCLLIWCIQSRTRLFADDCILYRQIKTQQDCAILQEDLNKLAAWEQKWGMAFHPDKCSTIRISRSRNPITTDYTLKGHTLTTEDYTKYLGVKLQSTFSWNRHIDQTVKKANSMVGFLRRNLKSQHRSNQGLCLQLDGKTPVRVLFFCLEFLYQGIYPED